MIPGKRTVPRMGQYIQEDGAGVGCSTLKYCITIHIYIRQRISTYHKIAGKARVTRIRQNAQENRGRIIASALEDDSSILVNISCPQTSYAGCNLFQSISTVGVHRRKIY